MTDKVQEIFYDTENAAMCSLTFDLFNIKRINRQSCTVGPFPNPSQLMKRASVIYLPA